MQLYLNGTLATTGRTRESGTLETSGTIWFNKLSNYDAENELFVFGGQIFQFNIYPQVLSPESIKKIADGGLCGFDLNLPGTLSWEDITAKSRTGSVREVEVNEVCGTTREGLLRQLDLVT
jgi:hypothetical protein